MPPQRVDPVRRGLPRVINERSGYPAGNDVRLRVNDRNALGDLGTGLVDRRVGDRCRGKLIRKADTRELGELPFLKYKLGKRGRREQVAAIGRLCEEILLVLTVVLNGL